MMQIDVNKITLSDLLGFFFNDAIAIMSAMRIEAPMTACKDVVEMNVCNCSDS